MVFYLPDKGNQITLRDISIGVLRITAHAKKYFKESGDRVKVIVNGRKSEVKYLRRENRSDLLYLGTDLFALLSVGKKCKLRITCLNTGEFIFENEFFLFLSSETDGINYSQLKELKRKYLMSLKVHSFPSPPQNASAIQMIKYLKRRTDDSNHQIGPYFGLTIFEAANRIATDLIIINGILQLIDNGIEPADSIVTVRLGNKHTKGKGDFTINNKEGEAFNVATSFFKGKLGSTLRKWTAKGALCYILINAENIKDLEHDKLDKKIIPVADWDKEE